MKYADRKVINDKITEELERILEQADLNLTAVEKEAVSELKATINDTSDNVIDYFTPADTLMEQNEQWKRVALLSSEIMIQDKPDIYYYQFCGKMLIANKRYRAAVELFEKAIEKHEGALEYDGELANFYALLSLATLENGSPRGAIPYATKALGLCAAAHVDNKRIFENFTAIAEGDDKNAEDTSIAMEVLQRASQLHRQRDKKHNGAVG